MTNDDCCAELGDLREAYRRLAAIAVEATEDPYLMEQLLDGHWTDLDSPIIYAARRALNLPTST